MKTTATNKIAEKIHMLLFTINIQYNYFTNVEVTNANGFKSNS